MTFWFPHLRWRGISPPLTYWYFLYHTFITEFRIIIFLTVPRGWSLLTLFIPWLFLKYHHGLVCVCICVNIIIQISKEKNCHFHRQDQKQQKYRLIFMHLCISNSFFYLYHVFLQVRKDHVAPIYIINLLSSELIHLCPLVTWLAQRWMVFFFFLWFKSNGRCLPDDLYHPQCVNLVSIQNACSYF